LTVTVPLGPATVVGKAGARTDVGVGVDETGALASVVLTAAEQPASAAAAATAAGKTAENRWKILIECHFLRFAQGGRA
jgi:hypothetical protein